MYGLVYSVCGIVELALDKDIGKEAVHEVEEGEEVSNVQVYVQVEVPEFAVEPFEVLLGTLHA